MVSPLSSVTRDAFLDALRTGDVALLRAYFTQPYTRAIVAETERFIVQHQPTELPSLNHRHPANDRYEWCILLPTNKPFLECVLNLPVLHDQYEALQWLFSSETLPFIRETLALALPQMITAAAHTGAVEMLGFLLSTEVADTLLSPLKLQQALNTALHWADTQQTEDVVNLLVSHGADVNADAPLGSVLDACARSRAVLYPKTLVANGLVIVGEKMPESCCSNLWLDVTERLLRLGADCRNALSFAMDIESVSVRWEPHSEDPPVVYSGGLLHYAVASGDVPLVEIFLQEGFMDVDALNNEGQTALMMVAWRTSSYAQRRGTPADMTRLLLDYGADVAVRDYYGRTVLHHTVGTEHTDVVEMLMERGADPSSVTNFDDYMLEMLSLEGSNRSPETVDQVMLLLEHGLNPYLRIFDQTFKHLQAIEAAKEYIDQHYADYW